MYDNSCKTVFPNCLCRTCTRDKTFTHCCTKHSTLGQDHACTDETCVDYSPNDTINTAQIHIKRNAVIPFETVMKSGD